MAPESDCKETAVIGSSSGGAARYPSSELVLGAGEVHPSSRRAAAEMLVIPDFCEIAREIERDVLDAPAVAFLVFDIYPISTIQLGEDVNQDR